MSFVGHQPPPIFKRGPAPLARLFVFVAVCLALLVADLRFRYLEVMRNALSVVTYPLQMAAATPAAPALIERDHPISYGELAEAASALRQLLPAEMVFNTQIPRDGLFVRASARGVPVGVFLSTGNCICSNRISCSCFGEDRLKGLPACSNASFSNSAMRAASCSLCVARSLASISTPCRSMRDNMSTSGISISCSTVTSPGCCFN